MAQHKCLLCLDINLHYSCEKTVKSLVVFQIQAFKLCYTAAVQH